MSVAVVCQECYAVVAEVESEDHATEIAAITACESCGSEFLAIEDEGEGYEG